ncbi:MAG: hypothetical protein F6K30_10900 [Cyanothece sp. SIO2G6]|nr:hypothetical protein [Cyanothece sp. SIO2G6]
MKEHILSYAAPSSIWTESIIEVLAHHKDLVEFLGQLQVTLVRQEQLFLPIDTLKDPIFTINGDHDSSNAIAFVDNSTSLSPQQQWLIIKQATATGCIPYPNRQFADTCWFCPLSMSNQLNYVSTTPALVLIAGEHVNIRATPELTGKIIGTASYEIKRIIPEPTKQWSVAEQKAIDPNHGWYPIILNKQQDVGYVFGAYIAFISEQGVLLLNQGQGWKIAIVRHTFSHSHHRSN